MESDAPPAAPAPSVLLDDLNPRQREAAEATEGPVLVVAGAGSGKTRVLTYRVAHLVRDLGAPPWEVMAITFTNKAAGEMKDRVGALVGGAARNMWVSTFHSACVRILRREAPRLGYRSAFTIYDAQDSLRAVTAAVKDLGFDLQYYPPRQVRAAISNAKNELVDYEAFRDQEDSFRHRNLAEVYRLYQQRLLDASAMDFDDLLMVAANLFDAFPEVLEHYQERFRYLHVDEFQDTNRAQYKLVRQLAGRRANICAVGDADQAIYRFRGADIRNILDFRRDYPEAKVVVLDQNYRSTETILSAANAVIANNFRRDPKHLWSGLGTGAPIVRYDAQDEHDEAGFVADAAAGLVESGRCSYSDIAVLYRVNAQSRVLEEVFTRGGLPHNVIGSVRFYERREIKDVLAYLRLLCNPDDDISVKRVVNLPRRGIGGATVGRVERFAEEERIPFLAALKRADEIPPLAARAVNAVQAFLEKIEGLEESAAQGPAAAVRAVLEDIGYLDYVEQERTFEALGRAENLRELVSGAEEFEQRSLEEGSGGEAGGGPGGLPRLEAFLESVTLVNDIDELDEDSGAAALMTLHSAKGLEFPVVFIVGMEEGLFPHQRAVTEHEELEEERRLCYVGMTRAQERLYVSWSRSRMLYGMPSSNLSSRFLKEMPIDLVDLTEGRTRDPRMESAGPAPRTLSGDEIEPGDSVEHDKWGRGEVRSVDGEGSRAEAVIHFPGRGEKRLLLSWAPLEKLTPR